MSVSRRRVAAWYSLVAACLTTLWQKCQVTSIIRRTAFTRWSAGLVDITACDLVAKIGESLLHELALNGRWPVRCALPEDGVEAAGSPCNLTKNLQRKDEQSARSCRCSIASGRMIRNDSITSRDP